MSLRVLVVDDEKLSRLTTVRQLAEAGYPAEAHETPFSALKALEQETWEVVLTDLRMPSMDGLQFLQQIRSRWPETVVIIMTAYGTVETAVQAMHDGAVDFLTKPFRFSELKVRLEKYEENLKLRREVAELRRTLGQSHIYCGLVGVSPAARRVFELVEQFANNPANVLLQGETGTGKELVARAIHMRSNRSKGPFVAVPCGAIPRELAESELFGHDAGSFTGATRQRKGRVELARGGTLFLDDVDDLPIELQPKLLRVIQERQFERVGGEQTLQADVRLIAATKVDLGEMVAQKRFREDLYYRLKVLVIPLVRLRERREDILFLAQHFVEMISKEAGQEPKRLSDSAVRALMAYPWPGNIRELRHAMEYAVAIAKLPEIRQEDLPANIQNAQVTQAYTLDLAAFDKVDLKALTDQFEGDVIQWALQRTNGNQGKAADLLSIPRTTLQSKLLIHK